MKRPLGFTLPELIITLTIAGILIAMAVPSYYSFVQNNKIASMVNNFSAGLNYARMEAIKRGVRVSVCSASDTSLSACGTAAQWSQGWVVFIDADNNNLVDSTTNLVKVNEALPVGTTITASSNIISYDASGFVSSGVFTLTVTASGCSGNNARQLTLSSSGRLSIAQVACQ